MGWGGTNNLTLYPNLIIQKRFIRLISPAKTICDYSWPIFSELKVLLRHLYILKVLRMFYNRSSAFSDLYEKIYYLRRNQIAHLPKSNLTAHQMSYSSLAPRLFYIVVFQVVHFPTKIKFY